MKMPMHVFDAAGHALPDTGVRFQWASGLPIPVSSRGVVKCSQAGDATLRASLGPLVTPFLVRCRPVGMVELVQTEAGGKPEINNRIVLLPQWRDARLEEASDLPGEVRAQIESFFVSTALFTDKQVRVKGWASAKKAMRFVDAHRRKS